MTSHDVANIRYIHIDDRGKIGYKKNVFSIPDYFVSFVFILSANVGRRGRFFILIGFIFSVS